ncbi:long-chain fatty acid--CoA ligase [Bordetella genomosp. 9]|uniref:class I adenylate-forming enzyme family protein n=1 Tax=Bordetella genomosp. 9 TaxID=1416803 RepID=UPI000A297371|nr:AMP-binding protein [Bordetella genomosp. 9]ARP91762.1 long-chain fatty acid--CoA ligase [Bordetella genomosp. 9]
MFPIDFFFRAARRHPGRIALESPSASVTYAQLDADVRALAAALQGLDPAPQSRVAICAGNSAEHILALLAVLAAGKIWVPLNTRSSALEVQRIIDATEPGIVFADAGGAALVGDCKARRIALGDADLGDLGLQPLVAAHRGQSPVRHALSRDDVQAIKFTGGTTGLPKGVMQPYRAWNAGIINQIAAWGLTEHDRYVMAAPITHGTSTYVLPVLAQGGTHVLLDAASPATITQAFRERGGTLCFMPPTLIYMIMAQPGVSRADFPALRNLIYGGAPMPADKIEEVQRFFGPVLGTTYGQTEAPQIVTVLPPAELADPANRGSVGRTTWLSEMAIMAPDGRLLPEGELGEVVVRGDLVMAGYWRLPEKTAETIVDGWLHTGDVGMVDARGYLYLKDRIRDVVITGGFNVYPVDVENALSLHPAVYESTVFGVPDPKWGEAVHAAVQCHAGVSVTAQALMAHVRERLGPVQTPKQIHFYESLPRSTVGKVLKTAVRQDALKALQAAPDSPASSAATSQASTPAAS